MNFAQALLLFKMFIITVVVVVPIWMLTYVSKPIEYALIIGGVAIFAISSIPVFVKKGYHVLEPMTIMILLILQGITAKICLVVIYQHEPTIYDHLLTGKEPSFMFKGVIIMAIGYLFMSIGYLLPSPVLKARRFLFLQDRTAWSEKRFYLGAGGVLVFAIFFLWMFANSLGINVSNIMDNMSSKRFTFLETETGKGANQRLQFVGYYYYRLAQFGKYAFYIALAYAIATRQKIFSLTSLIVIVSFFLSAFVAYFTSDRSGMGWLILEAVFIIILLKKEVKVQYLVLIPFFLFLSSVAILSERTEKRQEQSTSELMISTLGGRDMIDFTKTCQIIDHVPGTMPYEWGKSLVGWIFAPIPKSMWPNKPLFMEQGNVVAMKIYKQSGVTGVYPGMPAELYWNFGTLGVWFGLFFFGWLQSMVFNNFRRSMDSPAAVVIYTVLLTHFTVFTFAHSWGFGLLKIILNILPLALIILFIAKKPKPIYRMPVRK